MARKQSHEKIDTLLSAYLDNQLSSRERARLEAQLQAEPELRRRFESMRRTVALLRHVPATPAPRNYILTPAMVANRRPQPQPNLHRWLAPALTLATAASGLVCAVVLIGGLLANLGAPQASAPAPYEVALEMTTEPAPTGVGVPAAPEAESAESAETPVGEALMLEAATAAPSAPVAAGAAAAETAAPLAASQVAMTAAAPSADAALDGGGERVVETAPAPPLQPTAALDEEVYAATAAPEQTQLAPPEATEGATATPETPAPALPWPLLAGGLALVTLALALVTAWSWRARR
jgi:hypothetical protein